MSEASSSYPFVVARVRAMEARLITKDKLARLTDAKNSADAIRTLTELGYGQPSPADATFEQLIQRELNEADKFLDSVSPSDIFTRIMRAERDYLNLKVLVKLSLLKRSLDSAELYPGNISNDKLKRAVAENSAGELPSSMKEALRNIERQFLSGGDVSVVGLALDRAYAQEVDALVKELSDPLVTGYFTALFDMSNIISFMRTRISGFGKDAFENAYVPGGSIPLKKFTEAFEASDDSALSLVVKIDYAKALAPALEEYHNSRNLYLLEKLRDDYLFGKLRDARNDIFSLGPLMFYYTAKQREAMAVRMIMTSKQGGIEQRAMEKRLREIY